MVLAGCLIEEKHIRELKRLGVKDSKQLTQKRREFLAEKIKGKAETFEIVISRPNEIDGRFQGGINLNHIEAIKAAQIINKINLGYNKIKVIIDCPSPTISKWQDYLKTKVKNLSNLEISCEHKADKNYVVVAAASILAKCVREKEMGFLREKYGREIGSGYSSDPITCKFLVDHARKYKHDGIFRQTWVTWKKACAIAEQQKL